MPVPTVYKFHRGRTYSLPAGRPDATDEAYNQTLATSGASSGRAGHVIRAGASGGRFRWLVVAASGTSRGGRKPRI